MLPGQRRDECDRVTQSTRNVIDLHSDETAIKLDQKHKLSNKEGARSILFLQHQLRLRIYEESARAAQSCTARGHRDRLVGGGKGTFKESINWRWRGGEGTLVRELCSKFQAENVPESVFTG